MAARSKRGMTSDSDDNSLPITKRARGSKSRSLIKVVISSSDFDSDDNGSDDNGSDDNGSDDNGSDDNGSDDNGSDDNGSAASSSLLSDPPPTDEIGSWPGSDDLSPEDQPVPPPENPPVPSESDIAEIENAAVATNELFRDIQINGAKARLHVKIMVQNDHDNTLSCRLGYTTHIFLTYTDMKDEFVGFINSWRISKPTSRTGQREEEMPWVLELLTKYEQEGRLSDHSETTFCMQALFDNSGNPRGQIPHGIQDRLRDDSLMFLELVYLRPKFQGQGLIGRILPLWHHLLNGGGLPEWYSFSGQIVLVPSRPEDPFGAAWEGSSDRQVERTLTRMYNNNGYETWRANQRVTVLGEDGSTETTYVLRVMGRSLP